MSLTYSQLKKKSEKFVVKEGKSYHIDWFRDGSAYPKPYKIHVDHIIQSAHPDRKIAVIRRWQINRGWIYDVMYLDRLQYYIVETKYNER